MKNFQKYFFIMIIVLLSVINTFSDSPKPAVYINGNPLSTDMPVILDGNAILVPAKGFLNQLSIQTDIIDIENETLLCLFNSKISVCVFVNSPLAFSMDLTKPTEEFQVKYYKLEVTAKKINETLYIPVKSFCDMLSYNYRYENGILFIDAEVHEKCNFRDTIRTWSGKANEEYYLKLFSEEQNKAASNIATYLFEYKNIGKDIWLNKPELNEYEVAVSDMNGEPVTLMNLQKLRIVDIAFTKLNTSTDDNLYNSLHDILATHYVVMLSNGNKCVITMGNNDYKLDLLPSYNEDIKKKFSWPKDIWTAIEQQKVKTGMNSIQVITSVGQPLSITKGKNGTETWKYKTMLINFSKGKVNKITKVK